MSDTYTLIGAAGQTNGVWKHTGQLIISFKEPNGTVVTLTLPDDWTLLLTKVPNSIEDLTYGG